MNPIANAISNRLSLRKPQEDSLGILAEVADVLRLESRDAKGADPAEALRRIRSEFPSVESFERDFPSLCFALATGVGKTRLMGAFITYLYQAKGVRHFFVLAPNLTIYRKLIDDFTPNTPKYVFPGIADFATNPPVVVTGDNYEQGVGVRGTRLFDDSVHVNVFNVSKINAEVKGGKSPRIKRLSEYVGESYFDYLAKLDDLVLLMDESHRYRAAAGVKAINELKPILGLELTATPVVQQGQQVTAFKNVIYSYPLSAALADGFVKEPAVATRQNFSAAQYDAAGLEKLKLEDGVRVHEHTKVALETYARQSERPRVKPFMLVVATDVRHAEALRGTVEADDFFEGRYKGKAITVHSAVGGEKEEEMVRQLLTVEREDNPTEIVIHVNMLKEGWDVTNLYTIVPLRAANARVLIEQTIGRGLRLPYGKRVGVPAVDRLTIVAHDRFDEIIEEARRGESVIRTGLVIGRDIPEYRSQVVTVPSRMAGLLGGSVSGAGGDVAAAPGATAPGAAAAGAQPPQPSAGQSQAPLFEDPRELQVAREVVNAIRQFEALPGSKDLKRPDVLKQLAEKAAAAVTPTQGELPGFARELDLAAVVEKTVDSYIRLSIDIPRIIVVPVGDVSGGFRDFDLDFGHVNLQPVADDILIQHLRTHERGTLGAGNAAGAERRPEDYLVSALMDFNDVSYDDHAELLYKLAGQAVARLRSYLKDDAEVRNVLQYHRRSLADLVHAQMEKHYEEKAAAYEAHVSRGFRTLRPGTYTAAAGEGVRDFRDAVDEKQMIRGMLFGGFSRCLYPLQKFDSDTERRFAVLLESPGEPVVKWFKPASGDLRIGYRADADYEPDFVVETASAKFLCEPKARGEMTDADVQAKARAAALWCEHASGHEAKHGGKPWSYLLIPHDEVTAA